MFAVGVSWMRAHRDAVLPGQYQRFGGGIDVAGMATTRDVRRRDQRDDLSIVPAALAQVAVEIDLHGLHGTARKIRRQEQLEPMSRSPKSPWPATRATGAGAIGPIRASFNCRDPVHRVS